MTVCVIGGAGYIGSHVVRQLQASGSSVVVVDDFSSGDGERLREVEVLRLDISACDSVQTLSSFFVDHGVASVMHFAAKKQVGESVEKPTAYYRYNVAGTANVLDACRDAGVQYFVFSSSAAVYGAPAVSRVGETSETRPVNPYGESKLASEWLVSGASRAFGMHSISLRYFNVVGAASADLADRGKFNLVPIVIDSVLRDTYVDVFGSDYDTPDGTCVRDYVHVSDLADAHLRALDGLSASSSEWSSRVYNVGTGVGTSVSEVLDLVEVAAGVELKRRYGDRRLGDPASLTADVDLISRELGWTARYSVRDAVESAWESVRRV